MRTYANNSRNRVSDLDRMAQINIFLEKPGFCVSPEDERKLEIDN